MPESEKEIVYDFESINKEPVNKVFSQYNQISKNFENEFTFENENNKKQKEKVDKILNFGFHYNSPLAIEYRQYVDTFVKLVWINSKYTQLADDSMKEIKSIIKSNYITKVKYDEELKKIKEQYTEQINDLKEKIKELNEEILSLPKEKVSESKDEKITDESEEIKEKSEEETELENDFKKVKKKGRPKKKVELEVDDE